MEQPKVIPSTGEKIVRVAFNASKSDRVDRFKRTIAALIDEMSGLVTFGRNVQSCIEHLEDAAMHGVKCLTDPDTDPEKGLFIPDRGSLQPHQQRVLDELAELTERCQKLEQFILTSVYAKDVPLYEQQRLRRQLTYMKQYRAVLLERLCNYFS